MGAYRDDASQKSHVRSSLEALRGDVLDRMLALAAVTTLVGAALLDTAAWVEAAALFVGGAGSCLWGGVWRSRRPGVAAVGFCTGCFATVSALTLLAPHSLAAAYYAVVIGVVAATRGAVPAAVTSGAAIGLLAALRPTVGVSITAPYPELAGLIILTLAVSWMATAPINTALQWSWNSYARAAEQTERLRDQQGLLNRTIKSLDEANHRLRLFNQEAIHLREAAVEAQRRKSDFAVQLSHELRTPLNLVLGFSKLIVDAPRAYGAPLPAAYRQDAEAIYRNALHLSALLDDVLDLGQIEADRMGLQREWVSIGEVVAEAVSTVAERYAERRLSLRVELPPALPEVCIDRTRIRQVLINLLANAARFTDEGGAVVRARAADKELTLSVSDSGIGIQPADLPHIWEEFRQFGPPERLHGGSGMGLAICKSFAHLHGGRIWAESTPGAGSTFSLALPRAAPDDLLALPSAGKGRPPSRPTREPRLVVLLAEDPDAAHLFERHLDGYRVVAAASERRAVRYARATGARGIIVAGPDGEVVARTAHRLMRQATGLPVFSCVLPPRVGRVLELGVAAALPKPVTREQLASALRPLGRAVQDVLIVDDDPETLQLLGRYARSISRRYQVTAATGGAEALALLDGATPDAVVLDLAMPGVDGFQVLAALRQPGRPAVPVIVVSGHQHGADDRRMTSIGVSRGDDLTVREAMRCLQHALDVVEPAPGAGAGPPPRAGALG